MYIKYIKWLLSQGYWLLTVYTLSLHVIASTHYAVLRSFLRCVYSTTNCHKIVAHLDEALNAGDFKSLQMIAIEISFDTLFSNEVHTSHELLDGSAAKCVLI